MMDGNSTPDPAAPPRAAPHASPAAGSAADKLWWYRDVREPSPPLRSRRPRWLRRADMLDALACLAVSTLCFSRARSEALLPDGGFYSKVPLGAPTLWALLLNIVGLAAAGFLGVQAIRRLRQPVWRRLAAGGAAAAFLVALNFARIAHEELERWSGAIGAPGLLALALLTLAGSLLWPQRALRVLRGAALAVSPLAVLTLAHALWMFLEVAAGPVWRWVDPAPLGRTAPSLRRVVWVVLEELDQRIAFEARPIGLELPELDRLRRESLCADAARPPAGATEISMPALITGHAVVAVTPTSPNDLELRFKEGTAALWSAHPNVFSRARAMGYDTAVIGWDLPYPRVLGSALGLADWRPSVAHEQARGTTFDDAFGSQWASLVPPVNARLLFSRRVAELSELALRTAVDGRF